MQNYWARLLNQRLSRRRTVVAGATAAGVALLAACGGDRGSSNIASGRLAQQVDTTREAKPGGTMNLSYTNDVGSWDPHIAGTWWGVFGGQLLSRLFKIEPGHLQESDGTVSGELVESFEFSPDRLAMTAKLRPNMPWHPIAPVNGRLADSSDVMFSWNRFLAMGTNRSAYANSINPDSPITSLSTPDSRTVVIKLSYPMVTLPYQFALIAGGAPHILPRETDGGYDIRRILIGTGPFYITEHVPSVRISLKRNPNYYVKDHPFVDSVDYPIVPEYATSLAQFKAGGIYSFGVRQEDILPVKGEVPQLTLLSGAISAIGTNSYFGYKPTEKGVFRDERVRQAYSMSWDRDLYIDTLYNVSKFRAESIPVQTAWHSTIQTDLYTGWWLDPKSKDFGPNAKYYEHNVAEAKKLLVAAGYANGVEVVSNHITTAEYGADYLNSIQILEGMNREAGFRFVPNIVNYQSEFVPKFRDASGNFEGVAYRRITPSPNDAVELLVTLFSKTSGVPFVGMDPNGKGDFSGDPYMEDQLRKARSEVDINARRAIVYDLQRYNAKKMYFLKWPGGATGLDIVWPVVKNYRVFRSESRSNLNEWLDINEPPLKRT